jgi:uncharacterized protein (DUF4415 family)
MVKTPLTNRAGESHIAPVGRPKIGAPKVTITLRLSADLVASIRATGKGYNLRVESVLRKALTDGHLG